jgi:uncharacterized protein with HEPN domain
VRRRRITGCCGFTHFSPSGVAADLRAVVIVVEGVVKGTIRSAQEYPTPLLVLSGVEYESIPFPTLHTRLREAVERVLEVCGEAMTNLYRVAPTVAETIPHARDIIGFRNILAHGYAELDHNKVYNIAIAHAPQLLLAVQKALKAFDPPSPL